MPLDGLLQLIEQAIDRRLEQVGFTLPPAHAAGGLGDADEIGEPVAEYDAAWRRSIESRALAERFVGSRAASAAPPAPLLGARLLPATVPEISADSLTASEAAERLGVNDSRIRQRLGDGSLYGFKHGGSWRLPLWQFEGEETIPRLGDVIRELDPDASPIAVTRWFTTPWEDLVDGERLLSPRRWLLEGRDVEPVLAQARMI